MSLKLFSVCPALEDNHQTWTLKLPRIRKLSNLCRIKDKGEFTDEAVIISGRCKHRPGVSPLMTKEMSEDSAADTCTWAREWCEECVLPLISLCGGSHMEAVLLCCLSLWIICFNVTAGGRRESGGHCAPGTTVTSCQCATDPLYEHQCGMNRLLFTAQHWNTLVQRQRSVFILCIDLLSMHSLIQSVRATTLCRYKLPVNCPR